MRTAAFALVLAVAGCAPSASSLRPSIHASAEGRPRTLVVYDDAGDYAWLGELYAAGLGVTVSHFGPWRPQAISSYRRGEMAAFSAVVYVGSTFDRPLSSAFMSDVVAGGTPVVWIGGNVDQLVAKVPDFARRYGFVPGAVDRGPFHVVRYKGVPLERRADAAEGLTIVSDVVPSVATVLARAERDDGTSTPWALRSGNLVYFAENPMAYVTPGDRYLALCDLLFDVLAPWTAPRHRAVVRIEDVTPRSAPEQLRAVADVLSSRGVAFAIALVPTHVNGATGERLHLAEAPLVVDALRYMLAHGGSLVLHGATHQYAAEKNPFSGVSGDDFEFYRAHTTGGAVVLDGPVAEDSEAWAAGRIRGALAEVARAGLPRPRVFEYPHYAGSPVDSRAIARSIGTAFQREVVFAGALRGRGEDTTRPLGLTLPFVVQDVYGWRVVPENLGSYVPAPVLGAEVQAPELLAARARAVAVVRDAVAGFFFHPIFDPAVLARIVDDIALAGYAFVAVDTL